MATLEHHAAADQPRSMGLPISNGKLAMWLFLATEIMFFSGLIGAYIVLRFGAAVWPTPHDVHLVEWMGAVNTFVLICSSVTVVLAHKAMTDHRVGTAILYILATLALGGVFLVIKAVEYNAKFEHHIIPGQIYENPADALNVVIGQREVMHKSPQERAADPVLVKAQELRDRFIAGELTKAQLAAEYHALRQAYPDAHFPELIPNGNLWASLYFALTGIHALHVLGGMVIFILMLLMAAFGRFTTQQTAFVEYAGLYWHFVDIVWIFLFPLLYLLG
jgi:cytochrome c oxidase subunit 3